MRNISITHAMWGNISIRRVFYNISRLSDANMHQYNRSHWIVVNTFCDNTCAVVKCTNNNDNNRSRYCISKYRDFHCRKRSAVRENGGRLASDPVCWTFSDDIFHPPFAGRDEIWRQHLTNWTGQSFLKYHKIANDSMAQWGFPTQWTYL